MTMLSRAVTLLAALALALSAAPGYAQKEYGGITFDPPSFEHVASGPQSYFNLRDGLSAVVDTLAGSVAFLDGKGAIVGRAALPEGYLVGEIKSEEARVRLLSADGRSAIDIPRDIEGAAPPALSAASVAPGARRAGAGRLRRSSTELAIDSEPRGAVRPQGWLEIKSVSGGPVADAREFGVDSEGHRYVLWNEVAGTDPAISVRAFVGRYDAQGAITGIAEAPIADMEYVPDNYASVSAKGDITIMTPAKTGVEIRALPLQTVERASGRGSDMGELKRALRKGRKAGRVLKIKTDFLANPKLIDAPLKKRGPVERQAINPIPREKVLEFAREFLTVEWTLVAKNFERPGIPNECNKVLRRYWSRPKWFSREMIDKTVARVPYKWGGFDSPSIFKQRLQSNALAGDVCTCRDSDHGDCVVPEAAGVDCSGFISRAWGLVEKEGTSSLPNLSTVISNWFPQTASNMIKAGDALNKSGNHVRLVISFKTDPEVRITVIESTNARTCKRADGTATTCEGACECTRPMADFNGYKLLRFKGIRD